MSQIFGIIGESSQHKKSPCLTRIKNAVDNIQRRMVPHGINAIENVRFNVRATERNKSGKNGMTSRRVYPAFFVAFSIQP